jgi:hypothetical protein
MRGDERDEDDERDDRSDERDHLGHEDEESDRALTRIADLAQRGCSSSGRGEWVDEDAALHSLRVRPVIRPVIVLHLPMVGTRFACVSLASARFGYPLA